MPQEEKDVKTDDSSPAEKEEGVTDYLDALGGGEEKQEEKAQEAAEETSAPEVKQESDDGRPDRNLFWETKRKVDDLYPVINEIKEKLTTFQAPEQKPQYTKAQLRAFAETATDPSHKTWAYEEIDKLEKIERQQEMTRLFSDHTRRTQEEMQRSKAGEFVMQNFPECVLKDETGKPMGWNSNHPLTRKIGEYMQNPDLARNPNGLVVAAKMAAYDLGISQSRKLQTKINQTTAQLRREQKKQLISGGGTPACQQEGSKTKVAKLAQEYQKTGDKTIFKELARARGLLPAE